jgi:hypothetical protein
MVEQLFKIRVNSSEINKDKGFDVLEQSGLSIICLADEEYVISGQAVKKLRENEVMFDILEINGADVQGANKGKN